MRKIDTDKPKNPFMFMREIPINSFKRKGLDEKIATDSSTFTISEIKEESLDAGKYIKLFKGDDFKALISMGLSGAALATMLAIANKLPYNNDLIAISIKEYAKELKLSQTSINNGLSELIDAGVIARYKKGYYWINPFILFFGNRVETYKDDKNVSFVLDTEE